jgi:cytochrome c oxidase assembly factor CtaG
MYTLYDFMTHIKGVEYILALLFIAGYILYSEVLKPKPFKTMIDTGKDDLEHIKKTGFRNTLKVIGKIAAAPFIGIAYVVMLPFAFVAALGSAAMNGVMNLVGKTAVFGWRPTEAYFTGKKKKKEEKKKDEKN